MVVQNYDNYGAIENLIYSTVNCQGEQFSNYYWIEDVILTFTQITYYNIKLSRVEDKKNVAFIL